MCIEILKVIFFTNDLSRLSREVSIEQSVGNAGSGGPGALPLDTFLS